MVCARWLVLAVVTMLAGCATLGPRTSGADGPIEWQAADLKLDRKDQSSPWVYSFTPRTPRHARPARNVHRNNATALPTGHRIGLGHLSRDLDDSGARRPPYSAVVKLAMRERRSDLFWHFNANPALEDHANGRRR
jgi:uncharacterized protein YceK